MKELSKAIGAWLLAVTVKTLFLPIIAVWSFISAIKKGKLKEHIYDIAIGIDILGNKVGKYFFEDTTVVIPCRGYGHDATVSKDMAYEDVKCNTLSKFGRFLKRSMNIFDKNHLEKTYKNHEGRY